LDARAERVGLTFAGLCALNGAVVPSVAKLTTAGADSLFVAVATTLFGGAAALVFLAVRRDGGLRQLVDARNGPRLAVVGLLGSAVAYGLFFEGARRSSALDTVLCLQVEPLYALLVAWLFLGHRLTFRRAGAVTVIGLGIALAVAGSGESDPAGIALLLLTPLCWQASHLVTLRGLPGVAPMTMTVARYVHGSLWITAWWLLRGAETGLAPDDPLLARLPLLAVQGVGLSFVGTAFWYQAIARLDLARATAIVVPSIPILSVVASFALLGEVPSARQWAGIALAAGGVLAFVTAPHAVERRERIPAATAPIAAPGDPSQGGDAA
jgi:drug/metabolite transporter (DMT)-like permease